jgi:hypothetical protein
MIRKPIPKFKSEKEEAQWWDEHRDETAQWTEQAIASDDTTTLSNILQHTRQRAGFAPTDSIGIDPDLL